MIPRSLAAALAILVAPGASCKKNKEAEEQAAGDPVADASPARATKPPPVDPDPYFEPPAAPPAPAIDAAPQPASPISEGGTAVFTAATGAVSPVSWTVDATPLRFTAGIIGDAATSSDVQVVMSSGPRSLRILTCRGLSKAQGGSVTAYSRGADVAFVACFTRASSTDAGTSWGVRVKWNKDKRIAELAGTWKNQGAPAFDSMDFDEKE